MRLQHGIGREFTPPLMCAAPSVKAGCQSQGDRCQKVHQKSIHFASFCWLLSSWHQPHRPCSEMMPTNFRGKKKRSSLSSSGTTVLPPAPEMLLSNSSKPFVPWHFRKVTNLMPADKLTCVPDPSDDGPLIPKTSRGVSLVLIAVRSANIPAACAKIRQDSVLVIVPGDFR